MRKALLVIMALFTTAQVFAASVTLSVEDKGDGWAAIRYSADANVSGFGLKVTADSGAIFTDIKDYNVGECTASVQGYGIFPGTIDINEDTGVVDDNGTPVAPNDDPGASGTGLDTNTLILEMGALYVEGNEPAQSGTLALVQVDKSCQVCIEGEPIRGNVVLTDGTSLDANDCEGVTAECFPSDHPDYAEWLTVGSPASWCIPRQCHGDADGIQNTYGRTSAWVSTEDFLILSSGWRQTYTGTESWIAADFDHTMNTFGRSSARVSTEDFAILAYYWRNAHTAEPNCLDVP